jgi:hypothetical protein
MYKLLGPGFSPDPHGKSIEALILLIAGNLFAKHKEETDFFTIRVF